LAESFWGIHKSSAVQHEYPTPASFFFSYIFFPEAWDVKLHFT